MPDVSSFTTDISWGKEPITADKLTKMVNNSLWLYQNTPRMFYAAHSINKQTGLKIVGGVATVAASKNPSNHKDVYFGSHFTGGCKPIVTTGYSAYPIARLHVEIRSLDDTTNIDHNGFRVYALANFVDPKSNALSANVYVHWLAMGY